jgi:hypothetical protein
MPFVNPFTTQNTSPSSSGASNTGFVNPFRGYTPPQAPAVATKPVQVPQVNNNPILNNPVSNAVGNFFSNPGQALKGNPVLNNPVSNFIGGIGEKIAEIAPKIKEFHFADNTNFFTPKGFLEQTGQGILNTPQEALKGSVDIGSNLGAGTSTPQQEVGDAAAAAQLPLLILSGGLLGGVKEAAWQTIKNVGEIGLKAALTQGAKETAISLSEQGIKGIAKNAAKEAAGGGAFGLLSGAQSGRNITDPTEYIKNMLENVGIGAATGAAFSIPPLIALPLARGLSAKEGAIFIKNAHGEPQIDHILISPEVAQHTVIAGQKLLEGPKIKGELPAPKENYISGQGFEIKQNGTDMSKVENTQTLNAFSSSYDKNLHEYNQNPTSQSRQLVSGLKEGLDTAKSERAQETNEISKTPIGKEILKQSFIAQSKGMQVEIKFNENGKFELPNGTKVDVGVAKSYDPQSFNPQENLNTANAKFRYTYSNVPQDKMDQALADIYGEFESSVAGKRTLIKDMDGNVTGVTASRSTFPKWIPSNLRNKDLMDNTMGLIQDGVKNFNFPDSTRYPRISALLNAVFDKIDAKVGVDTKDVRQDIMNTHEQIKASSQTKNNPERVNAPENPVNQTTEGTKESVSQPQEPISGSNEGSASQGITQPEGGNAIASEQVGSRQPESSSPSTSTTSTPANSEPSRESPTASTDQNSSGVLKPVGEGKEKVSRLAARVTDSLDKTPQEIKDQLGATYNEMNKKANIDAASKFVSENPDKVIPILEGKEQPPEGVLKNSIYVAAEQASHDDIALGRQLASLGATRAGQELSILTEINKDSPVNYMRQLASAREKAIESKTGKSVNAATQDTIKQMLSKVKDISKSDVANFVKDIKC